MSTTRAQFIRRETKKASTIAERHQKTTTTPTTQSAAIRSAGDVEVGDARVLAERGEHLVAERDQR